jgi:hypothetical protein
MAHDRPSLLGRLAARLVGWEALRMRRSFLGSLRRSAQVQRRVLLRQLRAHGDSEFGRRYGFGAMRTVDDFRRGMPITTYDDYAPYVERVRHGDTGAMFGRRTRLLMFAMTSGTTHRPKYIPVPVQFLRDYRRGWMVWGVNAFADHEGSWQSRIVQLVSAMDDERAPCGLPCGAMSGLTAHGQRKGARGLYALPGCCAGIRDTMTKNYVALRLPMAHRSLVILSANPSTLLSLARTMDERKEELLRDLADGTLTQELSLPGDLRDGLAPYLAARPDRAAELSRVAERSGELHPKDAWRLPVLGCWKGGTLTLYLRQFRRYFGDAPVRDIGLIASEGRMTLPLMDEGAAGPLDIGSMFFEFLPAVDGQPVGTETLLPHELETGGEYFILLTNSAGLYRYHIGDVVRVAGSVEGTPLVEFLSKGAHYASLTGEKLSEHQVVAAVNAALGETGMDLTSYCLAATWAEPAPYYSLIVERSAAADGAALGRLVAAVDQQLRAGNIEYEAKRGSGRLGPVRAKVVADGAWLGYDMQTLAERRRGLEQYKHKFLTGDVEFEKRFESVALDRP